MTRFKTYALAALCLIFAALAPAQGKKVTIQFWHYFSGEQMTPMTELIKQFQAQNPDITISPVYQGGARDLLTKLQASFASTPSNNPVIATVYENWTSDFNSKGYMEAVQDRFAGPDGLSAEDQQDVIKVFREGNTFDGKMVTMPFNKSVYVLYINSDRLAKAGFTTVPKTREEMKSFIEKSTVAEGGRTTYGFGAAPLNEALTTQLFAAGGDYFDKDGNVTIDTPEALAALTFLHDLQFPTKHIYLTTDFLSNAFGNQQVASYIYSSASFPWNAKSVANRFKWDVAPIPGPAGKQPRYLMQGTNIGIFKNRPQEERDAAWKFLKFLTNTKSSVFWETRSGYMPIRYSVLKDPEMQKFMQDNPRYAVASSLVLHDLGKQEPKMAVWEGVREDISALVDRVLSNKNADVKQELAATQKKAADRLARSKQVSK